MGSGLGGRIYTSDTWALLTLFVNSAGNGQADLSAVSDIIHTCVPVAQGIERLPSKQRVEAKTVNDVNNVDLLGRFIDDRKATKGLTLSGERWLKETLTKFLSWLPLPPSEVARNHIVSFLARYEAMPWRKHSFYRALKTFWKWASINHEMPNPFVDRACFT